MAAHQILGRNRHCRITDRTPQQVGNTSVENAMANQLRAIWERLLKVTPISLDDDFFETGGDSLLAAEMLMSWSGGPARRYRVQFCSKPQRSASWRRGYLNGQAAAEASRSRCILAAASRPLIYFHGNFHGIGHSAISLAKLLGSGSATFYRCSARY